MQDNGKMCPTITTQQEVAVMEARARIRDLTPRECWRMMDFTDEQFDKAKEVNSDSQLYKEAGNSIVVNVLIAILGQIFEGHEEDYKRR